MFPKKKFQQLTHPPYYTEIKNTQKDTLLDNVAIRIPKQPFCGSSGNISSDGGWSTGYHESLWRFNEHLHTDKHTHTHYCQYAELLVGGWCLINGVQGKVKWSDYLYMHVCQTLDVYFNLNRSSHECACWSGKAASNLWLWRHTNVWDYTIIFDGANYLDWQVKKKKKNVFKVIAFP